MLTCEGHLKDPLLERDMAITFYEEALTHDTGRSMRHDNSGLQINTAWVEERPVETFKK